MASNYGKRVVVTGVGVISPLGLNTQASWESLTQGKSGIGRISLFDSTGFDTSIAGEVKGFEPADFMSRKEIHRTDRFAQFAIAASRQALEHSGLKVDQVNGSSIGVIIGSGIGGLGTLFEQIKVQLEKGPKRVSPFLIPMMITDMAASQVSIALSLKGPNLCVTSACSSGADAVGAAYELIKRGDAQAMIAGGSEAAVNPVGIAAFNALKALSTRNDEPELASRPFDAERDGFIMAEGAASLVLEELDYALKRGATILAEITSYGASSDAFHITQPVEDGEGAARAISLALTKAGLKTSEIDYINAHGTSTQLNDRAETCAIKRVFGDQAYRVPISSTKSMTGHLIGAAGAFEAIVCIMTIQHKLIPPTINLTHPDPDCDLDYVPNTARKADVSTALSTSFGFGGHNSVLSFKRFDEASA